MIIGRALTIITLFLEQAEMGAGLGLRSLLVGYTFDCVAEG